MCQSSYQHIFVYSYLVFFSYCLYTHHLATPLLLCSQASATPVPVSVFPSISSSSTLPHPLTKLLCIILSRTLFFQLVGLNYLQDLCHKSCLLHADIIVSIPCQIISFSSPCSCHWLCSFSSCSKLVTGLRFRVMVLAHTLVSAFMSCPAFMWFCYHVLL